MAKRTCSVDGCGKPHDSRGWCKPHAARWRKYGDPLAGAPRKPFAERFWARVSRGAPDECWPWTGSLDRYGYGAARRDGTFTGAHRVAYELLVGPIPDGLVIDHLCRVRHCVNPAHMEPVTNRVNVQRGQGGRKGHRKTHCKRGHALTDDNVYVFATGNRVCAACHRMRARRRYHAAKAK